MAEARSGTVNVLQVKQVMWSVPVRNQFNLQWADKGMVSYEGEWPHMHEGIAVLTVIIMCTGCLHPSPSILARTI